MDQPAVAADGAMEDGSNVSKSRPRYPAMNRATVIALIAAASFKSDSLAPRMLPKRKCSRLSRVGSG